MSSNLRAEGQTIRLSKGKELSGATVNLGTGADITFVVGGSTVLSNIGFTGERVNSRIVIEVPEGEISYVDNIYWADGDNGDSKTSPIEFSEEHAGTCVVSSTNIQGMTNYAINAVSPGRPRVEGKPSKKGQAVITNSLASNCGRTAYILGTPSSHVENCVVKNHDNHAFWVYYNKGLLKNCRADVAGNFLVCSNEKYGDKRGASVRLESCYKTDQTPGVDVRRNGSVAGKMNENRISLRTPYTVPQSAKEAAENL